MLRAIKTTSKIQKKSSLIVTNPLSTEKTSSEIKLAALIHAHLLQLICRSPLYLLGLHLMLPIITYHNVIAQRLEIKDCKIWLTRLVWTVLQFARMKRTLLWTKTSICNQRKIRTRGTTNFVRSSQSIYLTNKSQRANKTTM